MEAWHEREYQRAHQAAFPKEPGLHHHHTTGDRFGDGTIEQPTQKTT